MNGTIAPNGHGQFISLNHAFEFQLRENKDKRSDNSPTDLIFATNGAQIGRAWQKEIKRGDQAGQTLISMSFDDPSFPAPINATAFPVRGSDDLEIRFERPRQQQGQS